MRRLLAALLVVGAVAAAALFWALPRYGAQLQESSWLSWLRNETQPTPTSTAPAVVATAPVEVPLASHDAGHPLHTKTRFGNARSFNGALLNAGLDPNEAGAIQRALVHVLDFRRCRPEHSLAVERDAQGALVAFEYHPSKSEFVRVTPDEQGAWRAHKTEFPIETATMAHGGVVEASLQQALADTGLPGGLSGVFVETFERKINFATDTRKGDLFAIVLDEDRAQGKVFRYGTVHALAYVSARRGPMRAFFFAAPKSQAQFYDDKGRSTQGGWLRTPLRYDRISSRFNRRRFHPILKRIVPHTGVDYAAARGTPVWAAANGTVVFAGRKGPNGNLVTLSHNNGYKTHYAHLHRINRGIRKGKKVRQRQMIGVVGSTGRSTGPHLHFALQKGRHMVDPLKELRKPGRRLGKKDLDAFNAHIISLSDKLQLLLDANPVPARDMTEPAVTVDEVMD